jgi:hypothetical protein
VDIADGGMGGSVMDSDTSPTACPTAVMYLLVTNKCQVPTNDNTSKVLQLVGFVNVSVFKSI